MARLPFWPLTCTGCGFTWESRADGGVSVRCPPNRGGCGKPRKMPVGRPRTSVEARSETRAVSATQAGDGEAARLTTAWTLEAPPLAGPGLGADAGQACAECGAPMRWTAGHTAVMCPAGHAWAVSEGLRSRVAVHGQALERREARSRGELAVRSEADDDAERAARISLHARREAVDLLVDQLETVTDPGAYDHGPYQQMAFEIGAVLRGYRPEIGRAEAEGNGAKLARIAREIVAIRDSDQYCDLADEAEQVAERRERQQFAIEQAAAAEARQLEDQRRAELAEREAERDRRAQARREASSGRPAQANVYMELATMVGRRQVARGQAVAAKGACGFRHRLASNGTVPAERLYGIQEADWSGQGSGYQVPGTPEIRACGRHFQAADDWIERPGRCPPGGLTCYWELG